MASFCFRHRHETRITCYHYTRADGFLLEEKELIPFYSSTKS
jgi:hypothetical protein